LGRRQFQKRMRLATGGIRNTQVIVSPSPGGAEHPES